MSVSFLSFCFLAFSSLKDWSISSELKRVDLCHGKFRWLIFTARYQRAFVDFFEDQLVQHGYDWRDLLKAYLFEGDKPLINNMICGCEFFAIEFDKQG